MSNDQVSRQSVIEVVDVVALIPSEAGERRQRGTRLGRTQSAWPTSADLTRLAGDHPAALVIAAGVLGFLAARLIARKARHTAAANRPHTQFAGSLGEGQRAERFNGSLKPHGDKLGNAARAAAAPSLAPTYPEG